MTLAMMIFGNSTAGSTSSPLPTSSFTFTPPAPPSTSTLKKLQMDVENLEKQLEEEKEKNDKLLEVNKEALATAKKNAINLATSQAELEDERKERQRLETSLAVAERGRTLVEDRVVQLQQASEQLRKEIQPFGGNHRIPKANQALRTAEEKNLRFEQDLEELRDAYNTLNDKYSALQHKHAETEASLLTKSSTFENKPPKYSDRRLQANPVHTARSASQAEPVESSHSTRHTEEIEISRSTTQTKPIENTHLTTQNKPIQIVSNGTQTESTTVDHADTGTQTISTEYANTSTQTQTNEQADNSTQTESIQHAQTSTQTIPIEHTEIATQTEPTVQKVVILREQRELDDWVIVFKSEYLINSPTENWIATVEDEYIVDVIKVGEKWHHCSGYSYKNAVYLATLFLLFLLLISISAGLRTQPGAFGFGGFPVDNRLTRLHALIAQKSLEWAGPFEVYM